MRQRLLKRTLRRRGLTRIEWTAIGGSFAVGIVVGASLLWGQTEEQSSGPTASVESSQPSSETPAPTHRRGDIETEKTRILDEIDDVRRRNEVDDLRRQLAELKHAAPSQNRPTPENRPTNSQPKRPQPSLGQRTLDYWNRMNGIIEREAAMRIAPLGQLTAGSAGGFIDRRIAAGQFALSGIGGLDRTNVDAEVIELAMSVCDWYKATVATCEKGKHLLTRADASSRRGAAGQQWKASEKKLRVQVEQINRKGARVRQRMSNKYRLAFPPLK